mmetsp:Transcript_52561/g.114662  ORF Transcript_52561/g.114662 Transcript_52561/m.114662 type:complete len:280 (-) Transcript_52561:2291-3130(-)
MQGLWRCVEIGADHCGALPPCHRRRRERLPPPSEPMAANGSPDARCSYLLTPPLHDCAADRLHPKSEAGLDLLPDRRCHPFSLHFGSARRRVHGMDLLPRMAELPRRQLDSPIELLRPFLHLAAADRDALALGATRTHRVRLLRVGKLQDAKPPGEPQAHALQRCREAEPSWLHGTAARFDRDLHLRHFGVQQRLPDLHLRLVCLRRFCKRGEELPEHGLFSRMWDWHASDCSGALVYAVRALADWRSCSLHQPADRVSEGHSELQANSIYKLYPLPLV